ncbi:MAG: endo-1,4-beta-xylanase [Gemmatimonadota bacterium]
MSRASPTLAVLLMTAACAPATETPVPMAEIPALHEVFENAFLIGGALNPSQFTGENVGESRLAATHFNTITPENVMKWELIHPEPGVYDFGPADRFVAFGEEHDMFIVGHTLVWHSQAPDWVFEDAQGQPVGRDTLLARMRDHIHTVVGRYEGRVDGWDVVNEALNDDGTLRQSPWLRIIGEDYLAKAFEYAHEADPDAELYYNDYSLNNPAKRDGAVRLVRSLQARGLPVTGIGMQAHYALSYPPLEEIAASIQAFAELGDVMITELDVAVLPRPQEHWGADISQRAELRDELNPFTEEFPDSMQQRLAERYADFFDVFLAHQDDISRVTFWGVTDAASWLNGWPIAGRTSYPLLFDRQNRPKPAFFAVVEAAREDRRDRGDGRE